MEQLEFRTFLLHVAKELTAKQFGELKFVLKGFVSYGKSEEMKEVFSYFEELERRQFLTPTNLGILKKALEAIGRPDLVEEIQKNEQRFNDLFRQEVKAGDNLEPKEYDAVCDGIEKAAGNLKSSGRSSGQSTPDLQKQLKLTAIDNEDEVQVHQFTDALPNSNNLLTAVPTYGKQKGGLPYRTGPETDPYMGTPTPHYSQSDKVAPSGVALDEAQSNSSEDVAMTSEEDLPIASNPEGELNSFEDLTLNKAIPKEPGESTEIDGTSAEKMPLKLNVPGVSAGAKCSPAGDPPIMSSHQEPGDDNVTDGNEDKEGGPQEDSGHKKTTSQGGQHEPAVCHSSQHDHGGARPKQKKDKPTISLGSTKQNAKEQVDQVTSTDPHGIMVEETPLGYGTFPSASNTKEPTEDECTSPTIPQGSIQSTEESEPLSKKAKSTQHVPGQGSSCQKSQHPSGAFKGFSSSEGLPGWTGSAAPHMGPGLNYGAFPFGPAAPQTGMASEAQQLQMLQQFLALQQSYGGAGLGCQPPMSGGCTASAADSPMLSRSYDKGGYSVAISRGTLCKSSDDKGVVMMESGAQFHIAIANNNVHAAEVDITFGGMYLGVWVVEAKRSLSNALIIEGSAWAQGRLTYFSASDPNRPTPNEPFGEQPEFNGIIELEFKPEILMLKLIIQHVRKKEEQHEIFMPDYKTATVGDLKRVINETLGNKVSCLVKNNSEILQEDKTMSSLALENSGEVIQVLYMEEELSISSTGRDEVTMMVDPFNISSQEIKEFIEKEIKIPVAKQRICFEGQNIDELNLLIDVLVKSKKTPVLKVDDNRLINIKVCLPNGSEHKVEMNWFETVNSLKEKMEALHICEFSDTLKFNDREISNEGRKQLIDLGFKNQSEVTVHPKARGSTHRGFSANEFRGSRTRGFGLSGHTRGFGDQSSSANSTFRGNDDYPSASSTLRSGPEDMQHDSMESFGQEGIAMLYGDEENVSSQFEKDQGTWKFSKEKKVVLTIQLIDIKRTGATGSSASSIPPGRHRPKYADGPQSTGTPPPVPE